ncbi:hypothetical protein C3L33_00414, partial [Rhododendron williamsianum]
TAEDAVRNAQVVDARARNISHNVRCTECGLTFTSRYCHSPQEADVFRNNRNIYPLLASTMSTEGRAFVSKRKPNWESDKDIYKKLEDDFEETVLYAPKFDLQTAALWLSPLLVAGAVGGIWAYNKHSCIGKILMCTSWR